MKVKVPVPGFNKDVAVPVPEGADVKEVFNDASAFIRGLAVRGQIRDCEVGVNPAHPSHEIVKDKASGDYVLRRLRFSAF